MTILETPRLLLRAWREDDAEAAFTIYSDPEVVRFLGNGVPAKSLDEVRQRLAKRIKHQQDHGFSLWAVMDKLTGELCGSCGLQPLEGGPEIEVGYHLARHCWGRGLATEAARACLVWGFETAKLDRIVGIARPENHASCRVLEKIGLVHEGAGHYYGQDVEMFALNRAGFLSGDHVQPPK